MMTRKVTIAALMIGIVLGAAGTEGFNVYRHSHDSQTFQERLRCKAVADAYVRENSTNFKKDPNPVIGVTVTLDKVDYSLARNSCVAELETTNWFPRAALEKSSVQDLLSGETLFSAKCTEDCVVARPDYTDLAFDYVMKNASEPVKLQTEWDNVHSRMSKDTTGSASPAGSGIIPDAPPMSLSRKPKALASKSTPK
jgi:hypothetical protein